MLLHSANLESVYSCFILVGFVADRSTIGVARRSIQYESECKMRSVFRADREREKEGVKYFYLFERVSRSSKNNFIPAF